MVQSSRSVMYQDLDQGLVEVRRCHEDPDEILKEVLV